MNIQQVESFDMIGIAIRTSNEHGQSAQDIPALWQTFMQEGVIAKIPHKVDDTLYCVYTDYELDHTKPYTTFLGCKVSRIDQVPDGMLVKSIQGGSYQVRQAKGNLMEGIVFDAWVDIWNTDIPRIYTTDFEVYGTRAANPVDAEVDIFVAIKKS